MINANATDAKSITNDLPLSLSISTESSLLLKHTGVLIYWNSIPFATTPFDFHFNKLSVCLGTFKTASYAATAKEISGTPDGFILGKLKDARKKRKSVTIAPYCPPTPFFVCFTKTRAS